MSEPPVTRELEELRRHLAELEAWRTWTERANERIQHVNSLKEDLLRPASLNEKLKLITDGVVRIFEADFARIWIINSGDRCGSGCIHAKVTEGPHECHYRDRCLHLLASSGRYTHLDGQIHCRVPFDCYKIGRIASGAEPRFMTNDVGHDTRVHDQTWARELGLVSFAGYRILAVEETPIGVLGLFSKQLLSSEDDFLLEGIANTTAHVFQTAMVVEALTLEKQRFQKLAENSPFGMVMIQPDGSFSYANPKFREMFGYDPGDVPNGREWFRKAYPDAGYRHKAISAWMEDVNDLARGETRPRVFAVTCKDGTEKTIHFRPVKLDSGEDLMTCEDITERKRMEDELRQSEDRYRTLVEDSFDGIFVQKGPKIIFANSRLYEMLGYPPGELEGMDHWLVYHPDYQEITRRRAIDRIRSEEVTSQYEVMLQKKDGASFLGEISARRVQLDGDPGIQVWIRDISGRRRSEEAQRRLAIAVEQAAEAIVITDIRGTIQYVNPAFEQIAGYSPDEVIGENPRILQSGEHDQAFYRKLWQTITNGKAWTGQFVNKKKDGTLYREDATISPVRDSSGKIVNYVAVKRDITHETQLQQQLLQAQKMEAIGTLAGGVAHDFNNLLQVVLGYSEILLKGKQEGDQDYAGIKKISLAGERGADLVQSLLTLSRKVEPQLHPSNLNHEILQVQKLLSRTIPKTIKIDLHLSGDLELVQADPSQVGQILMNLGVNARDAMPDGGTLTVETANIELDEDYCATHLEVKPGGYVVLSVSDSGHGMGKETLSHIFEPFFTTKEPGKGTGLGLATVYGIVKQHGGHILCYSEPGHGTTFKIYLPSIQTEEDLETPPIETAIPGGTETILLVEDEEVLRELGTEILIGFGYEVITAGNGREALDIYQTDGKRIALVILDLIMPEMDGKQCLKEILGVNPKARILIASGYSENGPITRTSLAGAMGFVEKPYNMRKLLETIREVLDED